MSKKRKLVILLLVIIAFFIFAISTIAFRVYNKKANNVITFGSIKMQLLQTTLNENNDEIQINDDEEFNIINNSNLNRIIKVKNLGKQEFFLRISLEMMGINENNEKFDANNLVKYNINLNDWIYKEGWYYYKNIVKEGQITSNLINGMKFDVNNITLNYQNWKFKFDVNAQAVQAKNNATNVLEAVGWPKNKEEMK